MKKLLSLLASVSLVATASTSAVACGSSKNTPPPPPKKGPSAQSIKDKIKVTTVALPAKTGTDTSKPATDEAIKDALLKANSATKLTKDELAFMSLANVELKDNDQANPLKATIKSGGSEVTIDLTVSIHATAVQISAKITDPNAIIGVPTGVNTSLNTPATQTAVKNALQKKFTSLTTYDLSMISFDSNITLTIGEVYNTINLNINDDGGSSTIIKKLTAVEIHRSTSDIKTLIDAVKDNPINIPSNLTDITQKDTQDAIKADLQKEAAALSDYDLGTLGSFASTKATFDDNERDNPVTLKITDDATPPVVSASITLSKVHLTSSASQIENKIVAVLGASGGGGGPLTIPNTTGPVSTSSPLIRKEILKELKADVTTLSQYDIDNLISIPTGEILNTAPREITFTIKDDQGGASETYLLNVQTAS